MPADLLSYGTKSRSQLGQELVARLKRGQAEMQVSASDIAADDDVADDGEGEWFLIGAAEEDWPKLTAYSTTVSRKTGSEGTPSEE